MKNCLFICVTIFFLFECRVGEKQKHTDLVEIANTEAERIRTTIIDPPIIIGGYATGYTLSQIDSITSLHISIRGDKYVDFTGIEQLHNLTSLNITLSETNELDFTPLQLLPRLQSINIGGKFVTQIPDLSGLPSLIHLEFSFANIASLSGLEKMTQLESLFIKDNRIPITNTEALRNLRNLKFLLFYDDSYAINVSSFWDLENLEELRLAGCGTIDLTGIGRLTSLKTLYLYSNTSKAAAERCLYKNIEEIGELPGLQELYLDESISSVEFLVNNVNLERLWLIADKERIDYWNLDTQLPLDISPLNNLRKLTILHIRGFTLENAHFLDEFSQADVDINLYETE